MSSFENPTIVVLAYKRLMSLKRLLRSLLSTRYETSVRIVVSIDGAKNSENKEVISYCNEFHWTFGEKKVIIHEKNLGIVEHVFYCLNLTEQYNSIILLEDDHYVSPVFYKASCEYLKFYLKEEKLFGLSLYGHSKNGYLNIPFYPLQEENDVYFAQIGFTQGLVVTQKQWDQFRKWYKKPSNKHVTEQDQLHPMLLQLDKRGTEWFPKLTKYLVMNNKFIAFPKISLSVNFHDAGTHNTKQSAWYQVPLTYEKELFTFKEINDSNAVYDSYMEILPRTLVKLNPELSTFDFEIDLNCCKQKNIFKKQFLLTTRKPKNCEKSFSKLMKPLEQNIIEKIEGEGIYMARLSEYKFSRIDELKMKKQTYYFYNEGIGSKKRFYFFLIGILSQLKII